MIGCKPDNGLPKDVQKLVAAYDEDKSGPNGQKLLAGIFAAAQKNKDNSESLYETGITYADELKNKNFKAACLNSLIKDYYSSAATPERIASLASLLQNDFHQANASLALKRGYIEAFPNGPQTANYKKAIPSYAQNIDTFVYYIGTRIVDDSTKAFKPELAREYVNVSEGLALAHPKFERAPDYLFNAAKTANTIKDHSKSLALYDWIISKYSDHSLAGKSLFMKAFTFDTELNDQASAKTYYDQFIKDYPKDDLADDAQFLLENLGLSEEELLNKIQAKQSK